MKNLHLPLYFILQFCCFFVYPQGHHLQFEHIGTADGLSQSNVLCITRDCRGFMWFGTKDGLNRYDGYKITVYKNDTHNPNSISNNYITGLAESKSGELWISTLGGGICKYDRDKDQFIRYVNNPKDSNSLSHNIVNSLVEDDEGNMWIGTDGALDMFDPIKNKFRHFSHDPDDKNSLSDSFVRYVFKDSNHNIWICTLNGGVNLYNPKSRSFTSFQHNKNDDSSIAGNNVYTMFEDSKHRLWIGTDVMGLDLFDEKKGIFHHFKNDPNNTNTLSGNTVLSIGEDAKNNLWIGTENGGLSIFNYSTGQFTTYKNDEIDTESISNNSICTIYKDSKNNMWLGNFAGGIDLFNSDKIKFTHFKHMMMENSLSHNQVLSIIEDRKKNIWIGTDGGGLNIFDPVHGNFTRMRHKKNNPQSICGDYVLSICEDSKGNIWIGTWAEGITVFNPSKNTFKHFKNDPFDPSSLSSNNAWKIFEDRQKNIWVGNFGSGLDMLNPDGRSFTHYKHDPKRADAISNNNIISVFEDSYDDLWISTDGGGLSRFNKKTKTFSRFLHDDTENSLSNNSVSSVFEDSNKNLWIATRTGLSKYNKKTKRFKVYTVADGLPNNVIFGVLEDDRKNLWISTNKGISCFNLSTGAFKNYGVSDGLQSNEFTEQAFCKASDGRMYFGGKNGFNQFYPDSIKTIPFEPPLVITNFQISNKDVAIAANANDPSCLKKNITETRRITLNYSDNVFSFEFATLNYIASEKKRYAYMLENFDKNWNEVSTARVATYTNLDPGKYLFKVRGLNNEGNWSSHITTIELIIRPPFWLTWWFKLAIVLVFVGSITAFYRFRVNNIKVQKARLQQQVYEQTAQLVLSTQEEHKAREDAENARIETEILNRELKIKNRETEIARIETELTNKELKIKNKELEQFAYVASHDLQEPLRTTSGFVKLIQKQYKGKLDEKADKYLDFISASTDRMKVLIKDLLDFSKIGAKGTPERIDCNNILKNVLADISAAAEESKADIQYTELPVIKGYPTEIKLLFQNLIINALKFRNKDVPPQIRIETRKKDGYWEFAFKDNGIGIDKIYSERIFDMFQRLHTNSEYPGSGIGLSHCKKIVELHAGKIWVESFPGEGSIFYFTIPDKSTL